MPNGSPSDAELAKDAKEFLVRNSYICGRNFASAGLVARALKSKYPGEAIERLESRAITIAKSYRDSR